MRGKLIAVGWRSEHPAKGCTPAETAATQEGQGWQANARMKSAPIFPREVFVHSAVAHYFAARGFRVEEGGYADLTCVHPATGERWIIEAKGATSALELDFRTGLGHLVQSMTNETARYALALPNTPPFVEQCQRVSRWVRTSLRLHWLLVDRDATVQVCRPDESL